MLEPRRLRRAVAGLLLAAATALAAQGSWEGFFEPFLGNFAEEAATASRGGKKALVVMYHFEECPYCARMKREVLALPAVQQRFRREFHAVAIDTRGAQAVTGFDGRTLSERDFARAAGIRATPTFIFHAPGGATLFTHVGAIYDPQEFVLLGDYVAAGAYRSGSFADFKQSRRKPGG